MELVNGLYNIDSNQFADPYNNGIQRFEKLSKYVNMAIKGLGDNTSSAIEVAKALYMIREEKLYENYPIPQKPEDLQKSKDPETSKIPLVERFHDFNAFCKTFFHCGKSTIYNYIALYERFGAAGGLSTELPPNFNVSDYTYTQLLLMSDLSAAELLEIKPDWTCSRIKKHIKMKKEGKAEFSNRLENDENSLYEPFLLNNDARRREFLKTYKRWSKCAECDVFNTHVVFYGICLIDTTYLVAVNTLFDTFDEVSFYKFDMKQPAELDQYYHYYGRRCLDMRWSISDNDIINFLRAKKIKSIDILKNSK